MTDAILACALVTGAARSHGSWADALDHDLSTL